MKFTNLKYFLLVFLFSFFLNGTLFSSENYFTKHNFTNDSTPRKKKQITPEDSVKRLINKDARRASLMSMVIPGLGQAYNKNYWYIKIPLIYGALGGLGYFAMQKNATYQDYHNELKFRYSHRDTLKNSFNNLTTDQVNTEKILEKKHRDFLFIGMGIVYLINIIDANVTAHMKTFDVSDKLSFTITPKAFYCRNSPYGLAGGISIALNIK